MENASKALLIAAAVLVVILLIAFGMRILRSSTDTSEQAATTGTAIKDNSKAASIQAQLVMITGKNIKPGDTVSGVLLTTEKANKIIKLFNSSTTAVGSEVTYTITYGADGVSGTITID